MLSSLVPVPRSWKPQALSSTARPITSKLRLIILLLPLKPCGPYRGLKGLVRRRAQALRPIRLAGDDVDQFARHYDHFADRQAFGKSQHVFVDPCSRLDVFTAGAGWHIDLATQFAVDLDYQLQRVLYQRAVILYRPTGVDHRATVAQAAPQIMADVRRDRSQQQDDRFQAFLYQRAVLFGRLRCFFQHVHQRHHLSDGGVEFVVLAHVLAGLADGQVSAAANGFLLIAQGRHVQLARQALADMGVRQAPDALEETVRAFDAGVGPFGAHVGRRGEHHEQAAGVGAELVDHRLWVDAVVLGLGHLLGAADFHRQAVGLQLGADHLGLAVTLKLYVRRIEPGVGAIGFAAIVSVGDHHALGQQVLDRDVTGFRRMLFRSLVEEARVQQVKNGVFDTADVLIHRQPVVGRRFLDQAALVVRRGVTGVVPRGLDEGVHGVGFTLGRLAAFRAVALVELGHARQRRTCAVRHHVFRQDHRQLVFRHRHVTAGLAVDDRDRAAPVALAADAPVAQAELGARGTEVFLDQCHFNGVEGTLEIQAVELAGVDQFAVLAVGVLPWGRVGIARAGTHDRFDRQAVLGGKFEIALVVSRHGHYCAIAVVHQHVVGDPHRQFFTGQWVLDEQAGWQAFFLLGGDVGFGHAAAFAFGDERRKLWVVLRGLGGQRVFSGHGDVGRAHQGVRAGGEDFQCAGNANGIDVVRELHFHALGFADPVALHGLDLFRPARQVVEARQELIRIGGDLEVVHRDFALFDQRAGAPAATVDDLFVGQYGLVDRVPVHGAAFLVDHTFFEQAGEQPLFPAVVIGLAGGDLARPVHRQAQAAQLGLHVGDVFVGPLGGRHVVFHRGVFRRHAEGVPTHGLQDVLAEHALVARNHVADGVVTHVPHV